MRVMPQQWTLYRLPEERVAPVAPPPLVPPAADVSSPRFGLSSPPRILAVPDRGIGQEPVGDAFAEMLMRTAALYGVRAYAETRARQLLYREDGLPGSGELNLII